MTLLIFRMYLNVEIVHETTYRYVSITLDEICLVQVALSVVWRGVAVNVKKFCYGLLNLQSVVELVWYCQLLMESF